MIYSFICPTCHTEHDITIQLSEYDKMKDMVVCPTCHTLMQRTYHVSIDRPQGDGRGFYGTSR